MVLIFPSYFSEKMLWPVSNKKGAQLSEMFEIYMKIIEA